MDYLGSFPIKLPRPEHVLIPLNQKFGPIKSNQVFVGKGIPPILQEVFYWDGFLCAHE